MELVSGISRHQTRRGFLLAKALFPEPQWHFAVVLVDQLARCISDPMAGGIEWMYVPSETPQPCDLSCKLDRKMTRLLEQMSEVLSGDGIPLVMVRKRYGHAFGIFVPKALGQEAVSRMAREWRIRKT